MTTYLTVITTVLVLTQIIRVSQNAIQLHRQGKKIDNVCNWIRENDISERDFITQREVFRLLKEKLSEEE